MEISNNRLVGVRYIESPNGWRKIKPEKLVIHFTAINSAEGTVRHLKKKSSKVSAHIVLAPDGEIIQMKPFNIECWHVGKSYYNGKRGWNRRTIGIEIVNYGPTRLRKVGGRVQPRGGARNQRAWDWFDPNGPMGDPDNWIVAAHPLEPNRRQHWHKFTDAQIDALYELVPLLCDKYNLDVVGHEDLASPRGRKTDPGPAFPMSEIQGLVTTRGITPIPLEEARVAAADAAAPKWHYQLQNLTASDVTVMEGDGINLLVTDPSAGMSVTEIKAINPECSVYSYLSVGEAEDYRAYWQRSWRVGAPRFLLRKNPNWLGNYAVDVRASAWVRIVEFALEDIAKAGYDGVYLDKLDVFDDVAELEVGDCVAFAEKIIAYAHHLGLRVIVQNAEEVVSALDSDDIGWAKEDWVLDEDGKVRSARAIADIDAVATRFDLVLNIEYVDPRKKPKLYQFARRHAAEVGAGFMVGKRELQEYAR